MVVGQRAIASVGLTSGLGVAPLEEFDSVESWLLELPAATTLRVTFDDGTSYLASVARILDSSLLGSVVERFRIQLRIANLERRR